MTPKIKAIFDKLRQKYVDAGKTADWLRNWENGFTKKPTGEYSAKPKRKPKKAAPKKSKPKVPKDMHAALVEKLADEQPQQSLKPLPGESPLDYAKRRRKAKGEAA